MKIRKFLKNVDIGKNIQLTCTFSGEKKNIWYVNMILCLLNVRIDMLGQFITD